jgi:transcriptional regulator with XRE-family HTH domain
MKLNEFISFYRKVKGYTQESIASELNVSSNSVSQYETGSRNIPNDILGSLCEILNFSILTKAKKGSIIQIIFENDKLENFLQIELKKRYGFTIHFSVNSDDEYPENLMIDVYEEYNSSHELEKLESEFGELDSFSSPGLLLGDIFDSNDVSAWNIGIDHTAYPEYGEEFRTIVEFPVEINYNK